MSEDALYLGRVVFTDYDTPAAHAYWHTDASVPTLCQQYGVKSGPAHLYKTVGPATLNFNCADCDAPAKVTSRSDANATISLSSQHWRKEPYRCRTCESAHKTAKMQAQWRAQREKREREDELKWMPYREYLGTSEWAQRRRSVIQRADFRCQVCASEGRLHVHHRTYINRGNERPEDMIALCAGCHELFHKHGKLAEGGRAA